MAAVRAASVIAAARAMAATSYCAAKVRRPDEPDPHRVLPENR
jgi:hypothetical protein